MKAAIIAAPGAEPIYGEFAEPHASAGLEVVTMRASALSHLSKARSSGTHYSSGAVFPSVAGVDGVGLTADGRRVYLALPESPFGALAEKALVRSEHCVPVPDSLDDVTAAAIANPGMSAWASLKERARLEPGETVLINGATGTAGRIAVQLAKHLGAGKVLASGRNVRELEELTALGADVVIPFNLGPHHPEGAKQYLQALEEQFAGGIGVVVDYLWGESAKLVMTAVVKAVEDPTPVRFVQVGSGSGDTIELPGAALRSSALVLMGSGLKSVRFSALLAAVAGVYAAVEPAGLQIAVESVPLTEIASHWADSTGKPRLVFTMGANERAER